uniref:Uncharacterized protein n=1 Tax=Panagrolaimus sp. ES5 TaxID=591445 RepID=A0AC34F9U4_9BILA
MQRQKNELVRIQNLLLQPRNNFLVDEEKANDGLNLLEKSAEDISAVGLSKNETPEDENSENIFNEEEINLEINNDTWKPEFDNIMKETNLKILLEMFNDSKSKLRHIVLLQARELLKTKKNTVDEYIEAGFIPVFIECLTSEDTLLQMISLHALVFITSVATFDKKLIVDLNVIPPLILLLGSSNLVNRKRALGCINYLIEANWEYRDECFEMGFLQPFIKINNDDEILAAIVAETICNMCRFKCYPVSVKIAEQLLPILNKLYQSADPEILGNTFRAVFLLSDIFLQQKNIYLFMEYKFFENLLSFLNHTNQKIVYKALPAIIRFTSGTKEQTKLVVDTGVIPILIELIESSDDKIKELSLLALGNIALDKGAHCSQCIEYGLIPKMLKLISEESSPTQLRIKLGLISCLCQSNAYPVSIEIITELLPLLKQFIHHKDVKILRIITLIFYYIVGKRNSQMNQLLIENNIFKEVIPFLHHLDEYVQQYTSRMIINIVFGSPDDLQHVIDCGVIQYMEVLLNHENDEMQSRILFFLRKIMQDNKYVQVVVDANLIPIIIQHIKHENVQIQKNAVWAISNFAMGSKPCHMHHLQTKEFLDSYCHFLYCSETFITKRVLNGIFAILMKSYRNRSETCQKIIDNGGLDKIRDFNRNCTDEEIFLPPFR